MKIIKEICEDEICEDEIFVLQATINTSTSSHPEMHKSMIDSAVNSKPSKRDTVELQRRLSFKVEHGFRRRDPENVKDVFLRNAPEGFMPRDRVLRALLELDLEIEEDHLESLFVSIFGSDNGNKSISFEQFVHFVQSPSKVEQWTNSLGIHKIVADSAAAFIGTENDDPLRKISRLGVADIELIVQGCCDVLKRVLADSVRILFESFAAMDLKAAEAGSQAAGSKFQVVTMSCGKIADFHAGLEGRVGSPPDQLYSNLLRVASISLPWPCCRLATPRVRAGHGGGALQQAGLRRGLYHVQLPHHHHPRRRVELRRPARAVPVVRHEPREEDPRPRRARAAALVRGGGAVAPRNHRRGPLHGADGASAAGRDTLASRAPSRAHAAVAS